MAAPHASGADAGICPANNHGNSIAYPYDPDAPDRPEGSGHIQTSAGVAGPRRDRRAEAILDVWEANPTRGASWVAEQLGQPLTVIRDVLGDRIAKREATTGLGLSA